MLRVVGINYSRRLLKRLVTVIKYRYTLIIPQNFPVKLSLIKYHEKGKENAAICWANAMTDETEE
jgi:hypothetical protein